MKILIYVILMLTFVYFINRLFKFIASIFTVKPRENANNTFRNKSKRPERIREEDIVEAEFEELETEEQKSE